MKILSASRKLLVAPCLCSSLLVTHIVRTSAYESQINNITVTTKPVGLVKPLTQPELVELASMDDISSSLLSLSDLPERSWLMDDSAPSELAIYTPPPAAGDFEEIESDGWTAWAANAMWFVAAVAAVLPSASTPKLVLNALKIGTPVAATVFAVADLATVGNEQQTTPATPQTPATPTTPTTPTTPATPMTPLTPTTPTTPETRTTPTTPTTPQTPVLATKVAETLTATQGATVNTQPNMQGAFFAPSTPLERIVNFKRRLMLEFELDASVLAAL